MPRDGAGTYTLPPDNPVVAGETIFAEWANTTMEDIAVALTESVSYTLLPTELENILGGIDDLPVLSESNIWTNNNTFMMNVTVEGTSTFNGPVIVNDTLDVVGLSTFTALATFNGGITVTGTATFEDIYCNNLFALTGTGNVKAENLHSAEIILYEDSDVDLAGTPELNITMSEAAGVHTLSILAGTVTDGDFMTITTGTGAVGNWVLDAVGRVKIPAGATAIDDDRHLASKAYVDAAAGAVEAQLPTGNLVARAMGRISAAGSLLSGSGVAVSKTGTGTYVLTISAAASADKIIPVITPIMTATADRNYTALPVVNSTTQITVTTGGGNSYAVSDLGFSVVIYEAG